MWAVDGVLEHRERSLDTREFLSKVFYALSGDYHYLDVWKHPPGTTYLDALPEPEPDPRVAVVLEWADDRGDDINAESLLARLDALAARGYLDRAAITGGEQS